MSRKKGQIWSVDFISATVLLTFVLLFFILIWNSLSIRWNDYTHYMQMETDAFFAAEALMTTSGEPESWEMLEHVDENITALGLVNGRNELNYLKIRKLISENDTSYDFVKRRLGVSRYELGIRITDMARETTYHEYGRFAGGMDAAAAFDRIGILNGTAVVVHIEVWE